MFFETISSAWRQIENRVFWLILISIMWMSRCKGYIIWDCVFSWKLKKQSGHLIYFRQSWISSPPPIGPETPQLDSKCRKHYPANVQPMIQTTLKETFQQYQNFAFSSLLSLYSSHDPSGLCCDPFEGPNPWFGNTALKQLPVTV